MRGGGRSRRWLVGAAVVLLPIAVGIAVLLSVLPGQSETDALLRQWEDAGGATTVDAWRPEPVPDADNAAVVYESILPQFEQLSADEREALRDDTLDDVTRNTLDALHDGLNRAVEASERPACRWTTIDYSDPFPAIERMDHLSAMRTLARATVVEARRSAERDDPEAAVTYLAAARRMAKHVAQEPGLMSKLVASGIDFLAMKAFNEIFAQRAVPADVDRVLEVTPQADHVRQGILEEGFFGLFMIRFGAEDMPARLVKDIDIQAFLSVMLRALEEVEKPVLEQQWDFLEARHQPLLAIQTPMVVPALEQYVSMMEHGRSVDHVARAAVDLRRYHDEHGTYPNEDAWEMPTDPRTGEPLEYERTAEGFVIRSRPGGDHHPVEWRWE